MLHASYSPLLSLILGVVLVAAHLGWGLRVFGSLGVGQLPALRLAVAILAGQSLYSLLTFVLALAQLVTRPALVTFFVVYTAIGVSLLIRRRNALRETAELGRASLRPSIAWIPVAAMALMMLLYALAPTTKIDEASYSLLAPLRIWQDGLIRYYHEPFPAGIVPQMPYQIGHLVFFALGLPDAAAVVSLLLAFILFLLLGSAVARVTSDTGMTVMAIAVLAVGLYPLISYTTAGSHALMDLGTVTSFGLLYAMAKGAPPTPTLFAAISLSAQASLAAKLSMAPVAFLVIATALLLGREALRRQPSRTMGAVALPWLLFYLPWVAWTFIQVGSPFGPAFAELFPHHEIPARVLWVAEAIRRYEHTGLEGILTSAAQHHNPFLWLLFGICIVRAARVRWLLVPVGIAGVQFAAIFVLLPSDLRFLGGMQYVLAAATLLTIRPRPVVEERWRRWSFASVDSILILYVIAIGVYWWPHAGVVFGRESRESYLRRYVAFYDDFVALDRQLPSDAVIVPMNRVASIYAPRPVVGTFDLPANRPAFTFIGVSDKEKEIARARSITGPDHEPGNIVYENPDAVLEAYRKPWLRPRRGHLIVREIVRPGRK